jgi:hypothetical protein
MSSCACILVNATLPSLSCGQGTSAMDGTLLPDLSTPHMTGVIKIVKMIKQRAPFSTYIFLVSHVRKAL